MIRLKNGDEIKRIRDAGVIISELYTKMPPMLEPGITTGELDKFAENFIRERGGTPSFLGYMDYPASLCVSVNSEVIHGIPGKRTLQAGDIVSLDCGVTVKGCIADSAITLSVGAVSPEAQKLMKVTEESLYLGIEQAIAGNRIRDISTAVYKHAVSHGYGVVREFCGHGVGTEVHEEPQVPNYPFHGPNPRIKKGLVIAIEPMINLGGDSVYVRDDKWTVVTVDGALSAHYEHTIAVTEDGVQILTQ